MKYFFLALIPVVALSLLAAAYLFMQSDQTMLTGEQVTAKIESTDLVYHSPQYGFSIQYPETVRLIEAKPRTSDGVAITREILLNDELAKFTFDAEQELLQITVLPNPKQLSLNEVRQEQRNAKLEAHKDCTEPIPFGCFTEDDLYTETGTEALFKGQLAYIDERFGFDHIDKCINTVKGLYEYKLCYNWEDPNISNFEEHAAMRDELLSNFEFID